MIKLHFLRTMWSDIIILQGEKETALIDTGTADQFPMIRDCLDRMGVRDISFILLTHFHRDHYGCIPALLDHYRVGRVYLKEYSGLDCMTAWGAPADDAYRDSEKETFRAIWDQARQKSRAVPCENLTEIDFEGHAMQLFSASNSIRTIYEDASHPETWRQYAFSENQNSLAALLRVNGAKIFLGGDLHDIPSAHPLADRVNYQTARKIGEEIDLYKAPHHGTRGTARPETMQIYRPRNVVITNGLEYLPPDSEIFQSLRAARPDAKIYLTENQPVIFSVDDHGTVRLEDGPEPYPLSEG
ncbi:MAG: MBL fold metallo-hydrolase [Clostridia bacterium]|nr:MBL fold metallo-hydrolase [Clostridia bacterium]